VHAIWNGDFLQKWEVHAKRIARCALGPLRLRLASAGGGSELKPEPERGTVLYSRGFFTFSRSRSSAFFFQFTSQVRILAARAKAPHVIIGENSPLVLASLCDPPSPGCKTSPVTSDSVPLPDAQPESCPIFRA
jgi:hypothetical protein